MRTAFNNAFNQYYMDDPSEVSIKLPIATNCFIFNSIPKYYIPINV